MALEETWHTGVVNTTPQISLAGKHMLQQVNCMADCWSCFAAAAGLGWWMWLDVSCCSCPAALLPPPSLLLLSP
jgi:hypothetical protein